MKSKHSWIWSVAAALCCLLGSGVLAADSDKPPLAADSNKAPLENNAGECNRYIANLFLDGTLGNERLPGQPSTFLASPGFNWGCPLTPDDEDFVVGYQLGGDATFRQFDTEYDATSGFFARNFSTFGENTGAVALLGDFERTPFHNNLFALRPILGTTVGQEDAIGVYGEAGLNKRASSGVTALGYMVQEQIDNRAMAFWNHKWSDKWQTELSAGYEFGFIHKGVFGAELAYSITPQWDFTLGGEINTGGNYVGLVGFSYHFGATSHHETMNNIASSGNQLYTPFPKRVFAAMLDGVTRAIQAPPPRRNDD
jgi:hypothetical protein